MRRDPQYHILYIENTTERVTDYLIAMKKYLNKTLSIKLLTFVLLGALLVSLALMMRLGLFAIPWYDDYSYAKYTKSFQEVYGSGLINALRGACFQVKESWYSWQGTFSSIFLMALSPMGFNEKYYFVGPIILILLAVVSAAVLTYVIGSRIFGIKGYPAVCLAVSMSILTVWRVHNANQAFYWYNSGVHYTGMHSFMMLFVAVLVCLMELKKSVGTVGKIILSMLLAVLCSGANFVTALQGLLVMLLIILITAINRPKNALLYIPAAVTYLVGFVFNVIAPGNAVRAAYYTDSAMSPLKAVIYSFPEAFKRLWNFTGIFTLVFLVALAPIIWKGLEKTSFKFRLPGVFIALAFCFYATSYTPNLYGTGRIDLDRVINAAKLTYQFMLILSEIYLVGWIKEKAAGTRENIAFGWMYAVCVAVLAVSFAVSPLERIKYSPYGAYYYVHTGEAAAYHDGYLRQVEAVKEQGVDAVVDRNVFKPSFLYSGELSDDPEYEPNRFMAQWYGKNSIAVRVDETGD